MTGLSGAWLALAVLQLVLWIGACLLGAGLSPLWPRARARLLAAIGVLTLVVAVAALAVAFALASHEWAWAAEKLLVAAPIGVLSSTVGAVFFVRQWMRPPTDQAASRAHLGVAISAALGALIGPVAILLVGAVVTWPVVLAALLVWGAGSATALSATGNRRRRVVITSAALATLSVALLALFTLFGPSVGPALAGGHHLLAVDGDTARVSVADLRETVEGTAVHRFDLEAREQTVTLPDGSEYQAVTFGSVPGPELRVTQGELVEVTLTNRDVEAGVTLHWHGYDVPSGDDGVAGVTQDAVLPGESFVYRFVADQVGTYWYHTHQDALAGIVRGLYGALVVVPDTAPSDLATGDLPDVVALIHTLGDGTTLIGSDEVLRVSDEGLARLRLVNTDQVPHTVVLDADAQLVALDGTDLDDPSLLAAGTTLRIPAGGRADLVVDTSAGSTLRVERADAVAIQLGATGEPVDLAFDGPAFDVLGAASGQLPGWALGPYDVRATQVLDRLIRVVGGVPRLADTINGAAFPFIEPIVVDEGDSVLVTIINRGTETHPMHLHGHHMLVISRDGVAAEGALWLDTIDVRPGETWQIAFLADNVGLWMDHCHNLEHAQDGMVMHLAYRGVTSPFELGGEHDNSPE